jgi:hypothetical protein
MCDILIFFRLRTLAASHARPRQGNEVKKTCPLALYLPCSTHVFNLAVVHACELPVVRNTLSTMRAVSVFLSASAGRVVRFERSVTDSFRDMPQRARKLKPHCATRFIENHEGVVIFLELMAPVIDTLEEIATAEAGETGSKANELSAAMTKVEFIMTAVVIESFAALLLPLSVQLQTPGFDLMKVVSEVKLIIDVLEKRRENTDDVFHDIYQSAVALCEKFEVELKLPRRVGRQTMRENYPAEDCEEYFRRSVFIPYLDDLISELAALFEKHQNKCFKLQFLVPKFLDQGTWADLAKLLEFYSEDVTSPSAFKAEYERWKMKWNVEPASARPSTAIDALRECPEMSYPNIFTLLLIFATLPISTCTAERCFSCLQRLKSYLRSVMGEIRLNGLAHLTLNRDLALKLEVNDVIDGLARNPRRLEFILS